MNYPNDTRYFMSDLSFIEPATQKQINDSIEEDKKIDSFNNCCNQNVPNLLTDKTILTTKTIRRTKRIITTKFIAKSKSMDSETLKQCLEIGNYENIETSTPEITMEVATSEITTMTKPDPNDESKTITHTFYGSSENSKSLIKEFDTSSSILSNIVKEDNNQNLVSKECHDSQDQDKQINEEEIIDIKKDSNINSLQNSKQLCTDSTFHDQNIDGSTEVEIHVDVNDNDSENGLESNENLAKSSAASTNLQDLSIADQFNKIVKSRKIRPTRNTRTTALNKPTARYMTQPVISDKPGSAECLRDMAEITDSGCTNSVQDITMIPQEDKCAPTGESTFTGSHNLSKYSRSLSGAARISQENADITRRKEGTNIDKTESNLSVEDCSGSPDNGSGCFLGDENKTSSIKPLRLNERHLSGGASSFNSPRSFQTSLPGTLRRPVHHHIRIHSDEVKQPSNQISDLTSDYLNRKVSSTDKKEGEFPYSAGPLSTRYSPFRHGAESSGIENVVFKSPSAQALMRSGINRNRTGATNSTNNTRQINRSINSVERNLERYKDGDEELEYNDGQINSMESSQENVMDKGDSGQSIADESIIEEIDENISMERKKLEKRNLIIQELLDVESEYVKSLEIIVNNFMIPLKHEKILDDAQVDTIFNKIQELMIYHSSFLTSIQNWDPKDTIGDKIAQMFSKSNVQDCYASFIENFSLSEKMLENALNSKSSLQKFVEQRQRENKNKLPLKALIVQPVQRIPRYELLIKRLIEYTPMDSMDYVHLMEAQTSVHQLALKINAVKESKQDESFIEGLKLLERLLAPMTLNPNRQFMRHDQVTVEDRKEGYCLFLFSDQLIATTIKRRGVQTAKKPQVLKIMTPNGLDYVDNIKYKFYTRINIENIEFEHNEDTDQKIFLRNREMRDRKDLSILEEVESLILKLDRKHQDIDNCIKKLYTSILQDMEESKNSRTGPTANNSAASQFLVTTKEGIERMDFLFNSIEKKQSWEKTVKDLKNKLVDVPRTPRFNQALSITRTQSGMQFCCACPIEGYNMSGIRDVWICQSDGFTGHLCLLSMQADPMVTMNSPLPACNAKVICIIAVPGYVGPIRRSSLTMDGRFSWPTNRKKKSQSDEKNPLDTQLETQEDDVEINHDIVTVVDDSNSSQSCSDSGESDQDDSNDKSMRKVSTDENQKSKKLNDPFKATMWIGLEDGTILVFYSADNVRMTKSKRKIDLGSAVVSILHFDNKVYISLLNGEIVTFKRHIEGYWDLDYPIITKLTSQTAPIRNLVAVTGYIWGTSQKNIIIINPTSVKIEGTFSISESNEQRPISHLACSGQCVWITQENCTKVFIYHASTYEYLCEVNIRPAVIQRLQVWDDIIIRHKEACLRITCLLVCKDLLWIGTSAGVILNIPIPNIKTATTKANIIQPRVESLDRGNTGIVRFLVSLESSHRPSHQSSRRQSLSPCTTMATQMKIICGGDGFEEFFNKVNRESNQDIGKDDAINYILIWDIQ